MAIKFGDKLENQNSDYGIIDATGNHISGLVYVASFTDGNLGNITDDKRKDGTIVVAQDTGNLYVWTGGDASANFATASHADWAAFEEVPKLTTTLNVQLESGLSFGRFENGDSITISGTAKNAIDIIREAVTGYVAPTVDIDSSSTSFQFSTSARLNQSHTLTFDVTNNNQNSVAGTAAGDGFAIRSIDIQRRQGSNAYASILGGTLITEDHTTYGTFNDLNTAGTPTAVSFSYTDNDVDIDASEGSSGNYDYKIVVIANNSAGTAQTEVTDTAANQVSIANYAAPTSTETLTRQSSFAAPTGFKTASGTGNVTFVGTSGTTINCNTVVGDNDWVCQFVVTRNSPLVDISSYTVHRVVDGTESAALSSGTGGVTITGTMGATGGTITVDDAQSASVRETVLWRIKVTDSQTTTSIDSPTVTYLHLGYLGFSTTDNDPTASAITAGVVAATGASNAALPEATVEGFSVKKIAASLSTVHQFTGDGSNTIALNAGTNEFLYICYPDSSDLLTTFKAVGAASTLDSDVACSEASSNTAFSEAFTTSDISITNVAGLAQNYLVYRSVSPTAFDGSKNYSIF